MSSGVDYHLFTVRTVNTVLDNFNGYSMDGVKEKIIYLLNLILILAEITKLLQSLNLVINCPLKVKVWHVFNTWVASYLTKAYQVAESIACAVNPHVWNLIHVKVVIKRFTAT